MEPSIKGNQLNLTKEYLLKSFGPHAIDKLISYMDEKNADIVARRVFDGAWVSDEAYVAMFATTEKVLVMEVSSFAVR